MALDGRPIETAELHARIVTCSIDRIEIRGEGHKPDIGPRMPATAQDMSVYLDGERLEGWTAIHLEVLPNKRVTLRIELPTNFTIECPSREPGGAVGS